MGIPREREEITERKKSLAGLMSNIAEIGGANVERKIGKASVRDAIIGTGVAIDKMLALTSQTPVGIQSRIARSSEAAKRHDLALDRLPNTWQIDCHFVRFDAARCEFDKLPIFIGKSRFQRVATPLGFEPRITPPKGAVLPLHHGVPGSPV